MLNDCVITITKPGTSWKELRSLVSIEYGIEYTVMNEESVGNLKVDSSFHGNIEERHAGV